MFSNPLTTEEQEEIIREKYSEKDIEFSKLSQKINKTLHGSGSESVLQKYRKITSESDQSNTTKTTNKG